MFTFVKKWLNKDQEEMKSLEEIKRDVQEDYDVSTPPMTPDGTEVAPSPSGNPTVRTELSLHPSWEQQLDADKKYTLRFLQSELPEMVEGTMGVAGFSLIPGEEGVTVALFFRNGMTRPLEFNNIGLTIRVGDEVFARHWFNLKEVGTIPPQTSRPWEVFFPKETFLMDQVSFERWKVQLNLGQQISVWPKHLDLDPQMEERMTEVQKMKLLDIVNRLPAMRPDHIEFDGFDIGWTKDGRLVVGVLIRNALRRPYRPKTLEVKITDRQNNVIAQGKILTHNIEVRPGTSRPWMVVFPAETVKKPGAELHRNWLLRVTDPDSK
ncbi:SLAP domain-containing protein [Brevibacillus sp. B_LB10_24]|uniref:SLAP domain-containing protein n=1 Tax=Brevibacillus sp. B_LB10_24 TaxID=3380645 RepID=UPI0038B73A2C